MDLFDIIERETPPEEKEARQATCKHPTFEKDTMVWPDETFPRLIWRCQVCGVVRGRC